MGSSADIEMRRLGVLIATAVLITIGCGSSEPAPVDSLAADYCAICSVFSNCGSVVTDALNAACPNETRTYYQCVTDNRCDVTACESQWAAREACLNSPP
ncbi:MAG: hypothetical protein WCF10_18660 [Polyangiales bacterium]